MYLHYTETIPLHRPGSAWRYQRKTCHSVLSSKPIKEYVAVQKSVIALFLQNVVKEEGNFMEELRLATGRIMMSVTYGLPLVDLDTHMYIGDAEKTLKLSAESVAPGAYIVDLIRVLKHLPPWVPFNSIPKIAASSAETVLKMTKPPFEYAKTAMSQGTAPLSFTQKWLEEARWSNDVDQVAKDKENVMWMAATMFAAGSETTYSALLWFILAMAMYPDVQQNFKKSWTLSATIKEILRWRPPLPMAIGHKFTADEVYRDHLISKDTIVIPNVWY
ncbi:cytochrome P450 [Cyathus striatus]|nr:cytochrome P450 [Cyathus striatus]